ncbi:MAG: hypothetical protein IPO86_00310 [Saprospiraceae bacterium]|nr:hypothetical protein [Saprospiraceae bacterium]
MSIFKTEYYKVSSIIEVFKFFLLILSFGLIQCTSEEKNNLQCSYLVTCDLQDTIECFFHFYSPIPFVEIKVVSKYYCDPITVFYNEEFGQLHFNLYSERIEQSRDYSTTEYVNNNINEITQIEGVKKYAKLKIYPLTAYSRRTHGYTYGYSYNRLSKEDESSCVTSIYVADSLIGYGIRVYTEHKINNLMQTDAISSNLASCILQTFSIHDINNPGN